MLRLWPIPTLWFSRHGEGKQRGDVMWRSCWGSVRPGPVFVGCLAPPGAAPGAAVGSEQGLWSLRVPAAAQPPGPTPKGYCQNIFKMARTAPPWMWFSSTKPALKKNTQTCDRNDKWLLCSKNEQRAGRARYYCGELYLLHKISGVGAVTGL